MARIVGIIAVSVLCGYGLILIVIINWPNHLRAPVSVLQAEYAITFKPGISRAELESELRAHGLEPRYEQSKNYVRAQLGSYPTSDFYLIFPLAEIVRGKWQLDANGMVSSVEVTKYIDGP